MKTKIVIGFLVFLSMINFVFASNDPTQYIFWDSGDRTYNQSGNIFYHSDGDLLGNWTSAIQPNTKYDDDTQYIGNMSIFCDGDDYPYYQLGRSFKNVTVSVSYYDNNVSGAYSVMSLYNFSLTNRIGYLGVYLDSYRIYDPNAGWEAVGTRSLGWHNFSMYQKNLTDDTQWYLDGINVKSFSNTNGIGIIRFWCESEDTNFDEIKMWIGNLSDEPITLTSQGNQMISVNLTPIIAYKNDTLYGYCNATTNATPEITYNYVLWRNGTQYSNWNITTNLLNTTINVVNISSSTIRKNDAWMLSCQLDDGETQTNFTNSTIINILNTAPNITNISVTPNEYIFTNSTVYPFCSASDIDEDNLLYNWTWYKNDTKVYNGSGMQNDTYFGVSGNYNTSDLVVWTEGELGTQTYYNFTKKTTNLPIILNISNGTNTTLPSNCSNQEKLRLEYTVSAFWTTKLYCYDGTAFYQIAGDGISVEGVFWNISTNYLVGDNISKGDNITFECSVYDDLTTIRRNSSTFIIQNLQPSANSSSITPSPANQSNNLTGNGIYYDIDNDAQSSNQTTWYNNSIQRTELNNFTTILSGNLSEADKWIFSIRFFDGSNWSSWVNSTEVTIGDLTPPTLISPSATSVTVNSQSQVYANITDVGSSINYIKMEVEDPDGIKNPLDNLSMTFSSGNNSAGQTSRWYKGYSPTKTGTYYIKFYFADTSGNAWNTSDRNISFSSSASEATPTQGGGGSATKECSQDSDCLKFGTNYYCKADKCIINESILTGVPCNYNSLCELESGENAWNCPCDENLGCGIAEESSGDCILDWQTGTANLIKSPVLMTLSIVALISLFLLFLPNMIKKIKKRVKVIKKPMFLR